MGVENKHRYRTPGPGAYDVRKASLQCLKSAPVVAFGGSFNRVDRQKTGPLKVLGEKDFVPGPCSYAVAAEDQASTAGVWFGRPQGEKPFCVTTDWSYQARDLCERPHTLIFGRAARDDLRKLFLGKDAVAYVTSRTPGPGAYETGWQRPAFLFPSREPGITIGGPLANVDRVQTGPLGAAYRSDTPGPGAYNDDIQIRTAPTRRILGRKGYYSRAESTSCWSETESRRAITRGFEPMDDIDSTHGFESNHSPTQRGVEGGNGHGTGITTCEGHSWPGARNTDPFSLSPFRFVDSQGHDTWQLPVLGPKRCASTPSRRSPRASQATRSRSLPRRANGSRGRDPKSKEPTLSLSTSESRISWTSSSVPRPVTTFGTGTREQAGQVLAPGFKGYARNTIGNPGPGAYCNVPGSLGLQVDSTLFNSTANSFSQSDRGARSTRDAGVPGPGSYRTVSSLGHQISSACPTAPQPKFGTSVRCALEDGLVG